MKMKMKIKRGNSRDGNSWGRGKGALVATALPALVQQRLVGEAGVNVGAGAGVEEALLEAGVVGDVGGERGVGALEFDVARLVLGVYTRGEEEDGQGGEGGKGRHGCRQIERRWV